MQRIHLDSCSANTSGHPILLRFTSLLVPETPMKKMINLHYSFIVYIVVGSRNNKKKWVCTLSLHVVIHEGNHGFRADVLRQARRWTSLS